MLRQEKTLLLATLALLQMTWVLASETDYDRELEPMEEQHPDMERLLAQMYLNDANNNFDPEIYENLDALKKHFADHVAKRFSEFVGGKRFSEFIGGKRKRFSEFIGGKKRFSEFLGGKKRFSEFLGGKKRFSEFLGGKKRFSEFLGGKKRFSEFIGGKRDSRSVDDLIKRDLDFLGGR